MSLPISGSTQRSAALIALLLSLSPILSGAVTVSQVQPDLSIKLTQALDPRKVEADRLLNQGIEAYKISQVEAALQSWQQALSLYQQIKDRRSEGKALGNLGNAFNSLSNYPKAIESLEQSLAIAREIEDRHGEGNALGNLGLAYESLGNYPRAIEYQEQSLAIARNLKNRQLEGLALGNLGAAYRGLGDYTKAISFYKQSLAIERKIQERLEEGRVLSDMGDAYLSLGNTDQAVSLLVQSLQIAGAVRDRRGEAIALRNLSRAYEALGQYEQAIESGQKSLVITQEIGDRRGEAESLINLGVTYRTRANVAQAMEYHQRSLEITREIGYRRGEGSALGNLGMNYYAQGNYVQAIQYHEQRLAIAQEIGDREGEGNAMANLGNAYRSQGNYAKAIEFHKRCLAITRAIRGKRGEGQCLGFLGLTYSSLGNYPKAIDYYKQSLEIAVQINDQLGRAKSLGYLGRAYSDKGDYQEAIKYHQASLEMARQIHDRRGEGKTLGFLGNAYFALGKYPEAIQYYQSSLKIAQEVKDRRGQGKTLSFIGNAYLAIGNYTQAIEYQEKSLVITREIKDRKGEGAALNYLGAARFRAGNLAQAAQDLFAAITVYESLRDNLKDTDKVSIADIQRNPYNTLQQVLIAQNKRESALEIAERGRARAFAELLAKRTQGKETLTIQPIQIAAIQQVAREQRATLVEYANIYDKQLFIWVVKPTGEVVFRQVDLEPLTQEKTSLDNLVVAARCLGAVGCEQSVASRGSQTLAFNESEANRQFDTAPVTTIKNEYLQRLHKLLIDPIADLLPKKPDDRVIFVPQGRMFLLPFAALQDEQGKYLIEKHTIALSPSIQVLQLTHKQRQASTKTGDILLVGNPKMPTVTYKPGEPSTTLIPLPGAEQEAKAIAKILNVPALIGAQATKVAVLKQMPQARIIHLATHGLLDDLGGVGVPGAIALAPSSSAPNDGLLTANELLDLELQAELVVLSACDTGRGKITGDGVIGLSRSLITAGVPSVIVSLWKVPDAPTAELMTEFYRNLNQGKDKATALRQAMLDTKEKYPDPIAWASFELIGEAQ